MYHFKMQNSGFWGWEVAYYSLHPHKTTTENEKKKKKKKKNTQTHMGNTQYPDRTKKPSWDGLYE